MSARLAILGALVVLGLGACTEVPAIEGKTHEGRHYAVTVDTGDLACAQSLSRAAERNHAILERYFGRELEEKLPILVCTRRDVFDRCCPGGTSSESVTGLFAGTHLLCGWFGPIPARVLAHEQVHWFNRALLPPLPGWMNEGLAAELAHEEYTADEVVHAAFEGRTELRSVAWVRAEAARARAMGQEEGARRLEGIAAELSSTLARAMDTAVEVGRKLDPAVARCPVLAVMALGDDELERRVSGTTRPGAGPGDPAFDYSVAGALMRWAIETRGWNTLSDVSPFEPDPASFKAWLRSRPDLARLHERFPPIAKD